MPLSTTSIQASPHFIPGQTLFYSGFNPDVDTAGVPEDVWPQGGLIQFPAVADTVDIVSDSVLDTAAGTGARTLLVEGVNDDFDEISEIVTLDGLTPVSTLQNFLYVNSSTVATAGATTGNQGLITFNITGNLCNVIAIARSVTQACARILPTSEIPGTLPRLINAFALIGKQPASTAIVSLNIRTGTSGVEIQGLDIPLNADGGEFILDIPAKVTFAPGDILLARVLDVSANNTLISAGLQFAWF